jgi:hypothetical protein
MSGKCIIEIRCSICVNLEFWEFLLFNVAFIDSFGPLLSNVIDCAIAISSRHQVLGVCIGPTKGGVAFLYVYFCEEALVWPQQICCIPIYWHRGLPSGECSVLAIEKI